MSKLCINCGKELKDEQKICENCGSIMRTKEEEIDKKATIGFILGLISIVAWILPLAGYPVTICGIVFSSKGLKSLKNKPKAIAGLVLSIVFIVATFINSILAVLRFLIYTV